MIPKLKPIIAGNSRYLVATWLLLQLSPLGLQAQANRKNEVDSTYFESFRSQLTARVYLYGKYNGLRLIPPDEKQVPEMKYKPNTKLGFGIGASYHNLTINIGFALVPLYNTEERGKTRYIDILSHYFAGRWNVDLYLLSYRGYFLVPKGLAAENGDSYYLRHDLTLQLAGISAYRSYNRRRFSFQSSIAQNEWQKKSAGSFLLGGIAFYGAIHGDSVLVPSVVDPIYQSLDIQKLHFFEMGPGVGYAYTLVVDQHYFATASAKLNLNFRFTNEIGVHEHLRTDFVPNFLLQAGLGYDSRIWNISAAWVGNQIYVKGEGSSYKYFIGAGSFRLIFARRFGLGKKAKKALKPLTEIIPSS